MVPCLFATVTVSERNLTVAHADGRHDRLLHSNDEYTSISAAARCLAFRWTPSDEWND